MPLEAQHTPIGTPGTEVATQEIAFALLVMNI
jgi:hypothetical protein